MSRTRGTRPVPVERKVLTGNPGKRPLPEMDPAAIAALTQPRDVPDPPRPLAEDGSALWSRIWSSAAWVSAEVDVDLALLACELVDERSVLYRQVQTLTAESDSLKAWRLRAALRALDKDMVTALAELGFTPTDRARMSIPLAPPPADELAKVRARAAARHAAS